MLINCLTTACLFSCCAKRPQHAELLRTDGQWPGGGTEEQRWAQGEWMLCELLATACAERATRQQPNPTGKFHLPSAVNWAYRTRPRESWPLTAPLSLESSVQSLLKPQGCPQDKDLWVQFLLQAAVFLVPGQVGVRWGSVLISSIVIRTRRP